MKLEQSFEVGAPVEQVWAALIDLEKVAPCLPGAAITGHDDDGTYHGTFQVKLGPTTANYRGTVRIESADAATRTATLAAKGSDKRGQGGASATIVNTLHEVQGGTRVDAVTDFTITGRLASFGRGGMIKDISNRLLRDFATCLQQRLAAEPAGALTAEEAAASAGAETAGKTPAERAGAAAGGRAAGQGLLASALGPVGADPRPLQAPRLTSICIAGATGWTGQALVDGVLAAGDLELRAAVARSTVGQDLGTALGRQPLGVPVHGSVAEALEGVDVLIDYTSHDAVKGNTLAAIERGVHVVIGTSGLTAADFEEIDAAARQRGVGVIAAGNFSITAAMAQAAALLAARRLPHWEVIDYASDAKADVPSGTARELAERLAAVRAPAAPQPPDAVAGPAEARGASVGGAQVHSLRLPGFVVSTEVIFGLPDERLSIRHDAGGSATPYVAGTLLAARAVPGRPGLTRGLDTLLLD